MKHVVFKCRKCGYSIDIPEKTGSVLCGKCGTWNRPRSLFAALDQPEAPEQEKGSILQEVPGPIKSKIPGSIPVPENKDLPEDEDVQLAKPGMFSMIMLIFVAAPVISIIVKKLGLPQAATFIIITIAVILLSRMKKRS